MEIQQHLTSPFSPLAIRAYHAAEDDLAIAHILMDTRSWTGGLTPTRHTRIPESLDDALELLNIRHHGLMMYAVLDTSTDTVIGTTGITEHHPAKERAKIGRTLLSPDYWGRGLNHELKLVMLDWLFSMGIGRVETEVDSTNSNSLRSLLNFGFTLEGVYRRFFQAWDGSWRDLAMLSMLAEEWPTKREQVIAKMVERHAGSILEEA